MMYRVEDKYILTTKDMASMESRISTILAPDSESLQTTDTAQSSLNTNPGDTNPGHVNLGYTISSLYFDDIFDSCYNETIDGNPIRTKYRIRIYNNSFDTIKLEVKHKQYNRIQKNSCLISIDEMNSLINGEEIPIISSHSSVALNSDPLNSDPLNSSNSINDPRVAFNLAIATRGLRPKVIVTYERYAYVHPSGNVRITFDKNIRGSNTIEAFAPNNSTMVDPINLSSTADISKSIDGSHSVNLSNLVYNYLPDTNHILEVKYDNILPKFIAQTLENNRMVQTTNSKYCMCRDATALFAH